MSNLLVQMKLISTLWSVSTYDVYGNAKDGYDVNNVFRVRNYNFSSNCYNDAWELKLRPKGGLTWVGEEQCTVWSASPSDTQIRQLLGCPRTKIIVTGDDTHLYVNRARDYYPLGELCCVSHTSLSPIFRTDCLID
jgi:hypothetical protein